MMMIPLVLSLLVGFANAATRYPTTTSFPTTKYPTRWPTKWPTQWPTRFRPSSFSPHHVIFCDPCVILAATLLAIPPDDSVALPIHIPNEMANKMAV